MTDRPKINTAEQPDLTASSVSGGWAVTAHTDNAIKWFGTVETCWFEPKEWRKAEKDAKHYGYKIKIIIPPLKDGVA